MRASDNLEIIVHLLRKRQCPFLPLCGELKNVHSNLHSERASQGLSLGQARFAQLGSAGAMITDCLQCLCVP